MPKDSVSEILEISSSLTESEKADLQAQLPSALSDFASRRDVSKTHQWQAFRNITIGNSSDFSANQIASEAAVSLTQGRVQFKANNSDIDSVLDLLANIRQQLPEIQILNKLEKTHMASTVDLLFKEIKTPAPDKNFVDQAVVSLEKGLRGIEKLAEPTLHVSKMLAAMLVL